MIASVPSKTALATSLTSARVGCGCSVIDSSIWVAVMTGLPAALAAAMKRFCSSGTCGAGNSTPRSPRATMMPSAIAKMSAKASTASCFSSLANSKGCPPGAGCERTSARSAAMSLGLRTKLRAIASTPCAIPQAASARSFAVSVGADRVAPGRLSPLKLRRRPPRTTSQVMRGSSAARTCTSIRPSSIRIVPARPDFTGQRRILHR